MLKQIKPAAFLSHIYHSITGSPCKQQIFLSSAVAACGWHSNITLPARNWEGKELHPPSLRDVVGKRVFFHHLCQINLKNPHRHVAQDIGAGLQPYLHSQLCY